MALSKRSRERTEHAPNVFDSADSFALLLAGLRTHQADFTEEQTDAYNALRDVGLKIARKQAAAADAAPFLKVLEAYSGAPAPEAPEVEAEPAPVVAEVTPAVISEPEKEETPAALPPINFMDARRKAVAFEAPTVSNDNAPEAPVVAEVPTAPVIEQAPVIAEAPVAPSEVLQSSEQIEALAQEIESINREINQDLAKAGRHPWQLLKEKNGKIPSYAKYLNQLIAMRTQISKARMGVVSGDLAALPKELVSLADTVRREVKAADSGMPEAPKPEIVPPQAPVAATPEPVVAAASDASQAGWRKVSVTPVSPAAVEAPVVDTSFVKEELAKVKAETEIARVRSLKIESDHTEPNIELPKAEVQAPEPVHENIAATIADMPDIPAQPEETVDVPLEHPEVHAEVMPQEAPTLETPAPETPDVVVTPEELPRLPGEPIENPAMYSPEVEKELNKLLERWLEEGSGFFGLKKLGSKGPIWQQMAKLRVGDVIAANGAVPEGLDYTQMENLATNLRQWGKIYGISLEMHADDTVSDIMHRIVYENMQPHEEEQKAA